MIEDIFLQNKKTFTDSDEKIAKYFLENINEVIYSPLSNLSKEIGVGEATILRFCKKNGFKGFQNFKIELAKSMNETDKENLNESNYISIVAKNMIDSITATEGLVNQKSLEESINLICNAKKLVIFGNGNSGITAIEIEGRLLRSGYSAKAIIDNHYQIIESTLLTKNDVVIAVSLSGETKECIDAIKIAKSNNAKIISITSFIKSEIVSLSDVVLQTSVKEKPFQGGSMFAKVSQIYIADLIATGIELKQKNKSYKVKEDVVNAIFNR